MAAAARRGFNMVLLVEPVSRWKSTVAETCNKSATKSTVADTVDFVANTVDFVAGFGNKSATT